MEKLINEIIELEWEQFQIVQNEGGKADCQKNKETFFIMRKSQFLCWNSEVLQSYKNDLIHANNKGWNLLTEKYARMMESTDPKQYKDLEPFLPVLSSNRIIQMKKVINQLVKWQEAYALKYPNLAGNGRFIHSHEDTKFNTSFETYTKGEISTYSDDTFQLFKSMIEDKVKKNQNLSLEIMEQEVKMYGYTSLEEADIKASH